MTRAAFAALACAAALIAAAPAAALSEPTAAQAAFTRHYEAHRTGVLCFGAGDGYGFQNVAMSWRGGVADIRETLEVDGAASVDRFEIAFDLLHLDVRIFHVVCAQGETYRVRVGCAEPCKRSAYRDAPFDADAPRYGGAFYFEFADLAGARRGACLLLDAVAEARGARPDDGPYADRARPGEPLGGCEAGMAAAPAAGAAAGG